MAGQAKSALDANTLTVIADPGYYSGTEIVDCYDAGIKALVPKVDTSGSKSKGAIPRRTFTTTHNATNTFVRPGSG